MRKSRAIRFISTLLLSSTALAAPTLAQNADIIPPAREAVDENGVDLSSGGLIAAGPELTIGSADSGLSFRRTVMNSSGANGWSNSFRFALYGLAGSSVQMVTGEDSTTFNMILRPPLMSTSRAPAKR